MIDYLESKTDYNITSDKILHIVPCNDVEIHVLKADGDGIYYSILNAIIQNSVRRLKNIPIV
jgi:hypothetical protein